MKKHKLFLAVVTAILIVATLEITSPPVAISAPHHAHEVGQPDGAVGCIVFIIVVIVIVVVLWGLVKMCKKIPPPPPPDDDQPTNVTARITVSGPDTYMQFAFDPTLATNCFAGGDVTDEVGNHYQLMCSYNLFCSSNSAGPWTLDAYVTNWIGGTMNMTNGYGTMSATIQEVSLYDTNGTLQATRRWTLTDDSVTNAIMPKILMPPKHLPAQFYRLVLLEQ